MGDVGPVDRKHVVAMRKVYLEMAEVHSCLKRYDVVDAARWHRNGTKNSQKIFKFNVKEVEKKQKKEGAEQEDEQVDLAAVESSMINSVLASSMNDNVGAKSQEKLDMSYILARCPPNDPLPYTFSPEEIIEIGDKIIE